MIPIMLLSTLAILGAAPVHSAFAVANLALQPAIISEVCPGTGCTHGVGTSFQYTVNSTGIGGPTGTIYAYQYQINYLPAVLKVARIDSFGPFFDTLLASGAATRVTSIDNTNGFVSVAVSSIGATGPSTPATTTKLVLGVITFNVTGIGRSDQALVNTILVHNAGGGVLTNIPVSSSGATFSNSGLFGRAGFPAGMPRSQWAFPEEVVWSYSGDTVFTPLCLDLFANVNSTGTLAVKTFVQFTVRADAEQLGQNEGEALDFFMVLNTPATVLDPAQSTVVPLHTCYKPITTSGVLFVGTYRAVAVIFFQQINLDGSLGPVTRGPNFSFGYTVVP
jgi:hypothetical protein